MAYGGLRGAVGFSLVEMISRDDVPSHIRRLFVTTTLTIVTFTIFFQVSDLFFTFEIFSHFKNNQQPNKIRIIKTRVISIRKSYFEHNYISLSKMRPKLLKIFSDL